MKKYLNMAHLNYLEYTSFDEIANWHLTNGWPSNLRKIIDTTALQLQLHHFRYNDAIERLMRQLKSIQKKILIEFVVFLQ